MDIRKHRSLVVGVLILFGMVVAAAPALAWDSDFDTEAGGVAMAGDLLIVRPIAFVGLICGAVIFALSSPFSALGGNINQAAEKLVKEPAAYTFVRPLGEM